jgi:hypothetical protein
MMRRATIHLALDRRCLPALLECHLLMCQFHLGRKSGLQRSEKAETDCSFRANGPLDRSTIANILLFNGRLLPQFINGEKS